MTAFNNTNLTVNLNTNEPFKAPIMTAQTVGPASFPVKQHIPNNLTQAKMGMPFKPNTMAQGSMFSNARITYTKEGGGGKNWYAASDYIQLKRINAIGKSSTKTGLPANAPLSFAGVDQTSRKDGLARCRAGGCTAPKKKGALENTFKSGGGNPNMNRY
jgi:hypothetical protein